MQLVANEARHESVKNLWSAASILTLKPKFIRSDQQISMALFVTELVLTRRPQISKNRPVTNQNAADFSLIIGSNQRGVGQ